MQTRSVFDSIPLAMQDCQTHWRLLGLMGVLYAMMNGVMTLPGIVLDMAGVFESMFEGQLPTTFQSMTNEQQTVSQLAASASPLYIALGSVHSFQKSSHASHNLPIRRATTNFLCSLLVRRNKLIYQSFKLSIELMQIFLYLLYKVSYFS